MIKIEKAKTEDLEAILRLQYFAYQSEALIYNDFTLQPLTQTLDEVEAEYRRGIILKAVDNGEIVGSVRAYADGDTVYVGKLIVHPDHQGKGLGKRLLSSIENTLYRKRFELFTGSKSERNLHLYETTGYTRIREETDDTGTTLVYLEKRNIMDITIRAATREDVTQLLVLYAELQPLDPPLDEHAAIAAFEQATSRGVVYFVADDGGRIVGSCYIAIIPNITRQCSPIGFIENVITSADYRRRGIGRKLMGKVISYARAQGCYKVVLQSGIKRTGAHKFYESVGFDGNSKRAFEIRF